MTQFNSVLDLENNKYKEIPREIFLAILKFKFNRYREIFGVSLCGATANFEKRVKIAFPNSKGVCAEINPKTYRSALKSVPKNYKVFLDEYDDVLEMSYANSPVWSWEDYCCAPTDCFASNGIPTTVFGITFCLTGRAIGGKRGIFNRATSDLDEKSVYSDLLEYANNSDDKPSDEALIQAIVHEYTRNPNANHIPHSVILYHGGRNEKTPMVTIIFVKDDEHLKSGLKFNGNIVCGYEKTAFVDLIKVKKGEISIDNALEHVNTKLQSYAVNGKSVISASTKQNKGKTSMKGFKKGSPTAIKAGQKAKVSRKYNALIKEANEQGKTRTASAYKAHKTMALREIENA